MYTLERSSASQWEREKEDVHAVLYVGSKHSPNFSVKREDTKDYLHVPLKFAKQKRGDIEEKLPICVEFLMKHATTEGKNTGVLGVL